MERRGKHLYTLRRQDQSFSMMKARKLSPESTLTGPKMTLKGFLKSLKETTKLVTNAMELKGNHTKNLQALQRTYKFFSLVWQYI